MKKLVEVKNLRTYFFVEATDKQLEAHTEYMKEEYLKKFYTEEIKNSRENSRKKLLMM